MLKEFKEFALKGNVVDMAVGIIIGAAFGTIVKSLVDDILMPPLGLATAGVDFSNMFIALNGEDYGSLAQARQAGAPTINFGLFINNVIAFLIVAFALFMVIKGMNYLRRKQEEAPAIALGGSEAPQGDPRRAGQGRSPGKTAANPAARNLRHGKDFSCWGIGAMGTLRSRPRAQKNTTKEAEKKRFCVFLESEPVWENDFSLYSREFAGFNSLAQGGLTCSSTCVCPMARLIA